VTFGELVRCGRCHQRYPSPFGHRCPQESFAAERAQGLAEQISEWLETSEGRFAAYLARRERGA
jgi:hypothetical protein